MNWNISVIEPFYVFLYMLNDDKPTVKELIKIYIVNELKRIYNCQVVIFSNHPVKGFENIINENELENVNYPYLCDIMRRISLLQIEDLDINNVYELSKVFAIASLSIPGYYKSTGGKHCLIISDDYNVDYVVNILNNQVMKCNILSLFPKWILGIKTNVNKNQLRKMFNKYAFSGGKDTKEEQIRIGADLSVDDSFKVIQVLGNKNNIEHIRHLYGTDVLQSNEKRMLSSEVKIKAADYLYEFISHMKDKI